MRRELGQFKLISTVTLEMLVLNKMCLWNGFDFYPPVLNHTGTTWQVPFAAFLEVFGLSWLLIWLLGKLAVRIIYNWNYIEPL